MKTINSIISNSALGSMNRIYRYAVMFLFSSIAMRMFCQRVLTEPTTCLRCFSSSCRLEMLMIVHTSSDEYQWV